jgi:hypothetical protein
MGQFESPVVTLPDNAGHGRMITETSASCGKISRMALTQTEFEALIDDASKRIDVDIVWDDDEDHSPSVEFRANVHSDAGYPLFVHASYNSITRCLTYALIHRASGRIYALDLGKDHHNPACDYTGDKHKHRWSDGLRDRQAYVPNDITAPPNDPVAVWRQFCAEAKITHTGTISEPPPRQSGMWTF